jgi:O-antigen ligase
LAYDGHPSYISFYSIIAFTLLLVYVINREVKTFNFQFLFEILGLFSLSIYIIFLSSKAGVISWIIVCLLVLFKGVLIPNSRRFVIQVLGILLLFTSSTVILFPQLISRFTGIEKVVTNTEILKEGNDSNASRVKLWIAATNLWKEKPVFGQGVNGVNDKLYENIVLSGYEMDRRFNTHNQFLNELVIHGVFGILSIVLIVSVFSYFISNDWWYRILTFLVLLVELGVECMFNRQAGVVIFGMMMGVLMIKLKDINNA